MKLFRWLAALLAHPGPTCLSCRGPCELEDLGRGGQCRSCSPVSTPVRYF